MRRPIDTQDAKEELQQKKRISEVLLKFFSKIAIYCDQVKTKKKSGKKNDLLIRLIKRKHINFVKKSMLQKFQTNFLFLSYISFPVLFLL